MRSLIKLLVTAGLLCAGQAVRACDICTPQGPPLGEEVAKARFVVLGTIVSAKLNAAGTGGTSELQVEHYLKADDRLKGMKSLTLSRFIPPAPNMKVLVFLDVVGGRYDDYRGVPFPSDRVVKYIQEAPPFQTKAKPEERAARLRYFFEYLNDAERELANDAYKEWALAGNREVGLVAKTMPAAKLRKWFLDRDTPSERLSLYGYLLGACGGDQDADMLRRFIQNPDDRTNKALEGLLAGYIALKPVDGWKLALDILADSQRPFNQHYAVIRTVRFYHGYQPEQSGEKIVACTAVMLKQDIVADLAIEDLRKWRLWNHTDSILPLYGKPGAAPITKGAVIRYALCCPQPQAAKFIEQVTRQEPDRVKDARELLELEPPVRPGTGKSPQASVDRRSQLAIIAMAIMATWLSASLWSRRSKGPDHLCRPADPTRSTTCSRPS